ncbi:hypothetical protein CTI12_AA490920 [Artemisia annua]|uniref:Uncharacterized protein n=1 Tax=Artemisia annua TaxID=35608 RepID=A0A2U1LHH7_ARTAN|nr:hypothetical protein CTI12_AA490920 [Artemisia annua]
MGFNFGVLLVLEDIWENDYLQDKINGFESRLYQVLRFRILGIQEEQWENDGEKQGQSQGKSSTTCEVFQGALDKKLKVDKQEYFLLKKWFGSLVWRWCKITSKKQRQDSTVLEMRIRRSYFQAEMELRPWNEVVDFYRRIAARGLRFLAVAWHVRKCIRSALNCGVSIKTITDNCTVATCFKYLMICCIYIPKVENEERGGGNENTKEDVSRVLELGEEDIEMEVFSRSLIGDVKKLSYLVKLPELCEAVGLSKVEVKLLGGQEVMLVFETSGTADNIMRNVDHGLRRWVHKIRRWENNYKPQGRITWINILGVPITCWKESVFRRIAEGHGVVMEMNNCNLVGNQNITIGKVCVHTSAKGLINEKLKIKVKDITFGVSVIEEIRDVVEYQVQEYINIEKNEEDGHDNMNMEEDGNDDSDKERRNSQADGSDEEDNEDEEDGVEEKGDENNPEEGGGDDNGSGWRSEKHGSWEGEDEISETKAADGYIETLENKKACKSSDVVVPRKSDENTHNGSNVNIENDGPDVVKGGLDINSHYMKNVDVSKVGDQNIDGLYGRPVRPNNNQDIGSNKEDNVKQDLEASNKKQNQVEYGNIEDTMIIEEQRREKRDDSPPNPNGSGGDRCRKKRKKSVNGNFEGSKDIHFSHGIGEGSNSNMKKSGRRSINRAKNVARKIESLYNGEGGSKTTGCLSDMYKVSHKEGDDIGVNSEIRSTGKEDENKHVCSISKNELKEVGEQIGVKWEEVASKGIISLNIRGIGVEGKLGWIKSIIKEEKPSVIGLQETKCGIVDEFWVEEVWGNRCFGFTQLTSNGNSGGIILIWDANTFCCKEAMGDERFIAVKGIWKGMTEDVYLIIRFNG